MNCIVLNYAGNVGKSVVAKHCLLARLPSHRFIEIETINEAPEVDKRILTTLRGDQSADLLEKTVLTRENIVDLGASQSETALAGIARYTGSHLDYDLFIVPFVRGSKELADTISTVRTLSEMGVEPERIRLVHNKVTKDPEIESNGIERFIAKEKLCVFNPNARIALNDIYDKLTRRQLTIEEALSDETDFVALLQKAEKDGDEAAKRQHMVSIQIHRLAPAAKANLDIVFAALTEGIC